MLLICISSAYICAANVSHTDYLHVKVAYYYGMFSQNFSYKIRRTIASKLSADIALSENGIRKESLFLVCRSEVANNIFSQKV